MEYYVESSFHLQPSYTSFVNIMSTAVNELIPYFAGITSKRRSSDDNLKRKQKSLSTPHPPARPQPLTPSQQHSPQLESKWTQHDFYL